MLRVGNSPGVEWHKQERMHDQSHSPVQLLVLAECSMSALVCQNPNAGENEALNGGIRNPGCKSEVWVGEEGNIGNGEVDKSRDVKVIADDICH